MLNNYIFLFLALIRNLSSYLNLPVARKRRLKAVHLNDIDLMLVSFYLIILVLMLNSSLQIINLGLYLRDSTLYIILLGLDKLIICFLFLQFLNFFLQLLLYSTHNPVQSSMGGLLNRLLHLYLLLIAVLIERHIFILILVNILFLIAFWP
jgi:hypothetical protein